MDAAARQNDRPALVGRDDDLARLEQELARAVDGRLGCVLVLGEPGVGKTRLVQELLAKHAADTTVMTARAHHLGETTVFGVWAEALECHLRSLELGEVERLCAGSVEDLSHLLRSVAAVKRPSAGQEPPRGRLLEGLAVTLGRLARRRPVVLVIDDVHLADTSSLDALRYMAVGCPETRLLVVATARPVELDDRPAAAGLFGDLEQDGVLRRLPLAPLGREGLAVLATTIVDGDVPEPLVAWLADRSRGNPLYALGLLRALLDEGGDLTAPRLTRLPESLAERVAAHVGRLDGDERQLLEILAAVERRVEMRSLVALSDRTPDEVAAVLERLVRARLVQEQARGFDLVFEIAHPLVAEAIYESIGGVRRRGLHRRLGRALLAADRLGEAAPHFVRSADSGDDEAAAVLIDALTQAEQREAYPEALAILSNLVGLLPAGNRRWVDVVDALPPGARWVTDHRAAESYAGVGVPALLALDGALAEHDDPARRAVVKYRLASLLGWGLYRYEQAEAVAQDAVELFRQAGDRRGEFLARHELAFVATARHVDYARLVAEEQRLAADARAAGDTVVFARAVRTALQVQIFFLGDHDGGRAAAEKLGAVTSDNNAREWLRCWTAMASALAGGGDEAAGADGIGRREAEGPAIRQPAEVVISFVAGDYDDVVERGRAMVTGMTDSDASRLQTVGDILYGLAALEVGLVEEAERAIARAEMRPGAGSPFFADLRRFAEARLRYQQGRAAEAAPLLASAVTDLLRTGIGLTLPVYLQLPEWLDHPGLAASAASALDARAAATGGGRMAAGLARLGRAWALAADDAVAAAAVAEEAAGILCGLRAGGFSACAFELLGRLRAEHDTAGALDAFERAAAAFAACGATWRRGRVAEAMRALGPSGERAAAAVTGPGPLTSRERAVARLAARGDSARQIGEQLYIGVRTVESHLARAYAKLGVASKIELVRRAAELGLEVAAEDP